MEHELRREFQLHRQHNEDTQIYCEKRTMEIQRPTQD